MSFYRLPNPYNPHYAIPDYVMAEPPGRGTFTTQWLPRGTIPLMVPDFLAQTHDGQMGKLGVFAESTLHGSIFDNNTLGEPMKLVPSSPQNSAVAAAQQIAANVVAAVKRAPRHRQQNLLKGLLGKIHPRAHKTTIKIAKKLVGQGFTPGQALAQGITVSVLQSQSAGSPSPLMTIPTLGPSVRPTRRAAPKRLRARNAGSPSTVVGSVSARPMRRLPGGNYLATGAVPTKTGGNITSNVAAILEGAATQVQSFPNGTCDPTGGFIWDTSLGGGVGGWRRLRVGETCVGYETSVTPTVRVDDGAGSDQAGVRNVAPFTQGNYQTGPFKLISKDGHPQQLSMFMTDPSQLPAAWVQLVQAVVAQTGTVGITGSFSVSLFDPYQANRPDTLAAYRTWLKAFGLPEPGPGKCYKVLPPTFVCPANLDVAPVWSFKDGDDTWIITFELAVPPDVYTCGGSDTLFNAHKSMLTQYPNQPLGLLISVWKPAGDPISDSWLGPIIAAFADPASAVAKTVADIAAGMGMSVCQMVQNPQSMQNAMKASSSNPYATAALIAALAACPAPPTPPIVATSSSMLPLLLLVGGAGVIAAVALKKKRRQEKQK